MRTLQPEERKRLQRPGSYLTGGRSKFMPGKLIKDIKKYKYVYLMLIPVLAYYIIFCYVPMGGLIMAFKDYAPRKGIFGSDWVGFKYFLDFLRICISSD